MSYIGSSYFYIIEYAVNISQKYFDRGSSKSGTRYRHSLSLLPSWIGITGLTQSADDSSIIIGVGKFTDCSFITWCALLEFAFYLNFERLGDVGGERSETGGSDYDNVFVSVGSIVEGHWNHIAELVCLSSTVSDQDLIIGFVWTEILTNNCDSRSTCLGAGVNWHALNGDFVTERNFVCRSINFSAHNDFVISSRAASKYSLNLGIGNRSNRQLVDVFSTFGDENFNLGGISAEVSTSDGNFALEDWTGIRWWNWSYSDGFGFIECEFIRSGDW